MRLRAGDRMNLEPPGIQRFRNSLNIAALAGRIPAVSTITP